MSTESKDLASMALAAAALVVAIAVALFATGCRGTKGVDWSGSITCKDGVCTPTIVVSPTVAPAPAPRAQLEK